MYYRSFKIQGLFKANGPFSRPFQGKFKFKAFSRHPFKFKAFSSLYEPCTNLTDGLLINYTRIGSAFNKLSENIYFYILTLLIMAVVFDFLRAITEY